jgi:hypothetical protein
VNVLVTRIAKRPTGFRLLFPGGETTPSVKLLTTLDRSHHERDWHTAMIIETVCDEEVARRLPLPLAQLYRHAHNAKTTRDRHHIAYYLWKAALKLLGSTAIVEYVVCGLDRPDLNASLEDLARPSVGVHEADI